MKKAKFPATRPVQQTVVRSLSRRREQIATLRQELEDLNDYLDLTSTLGLHPHGTEYIRIVISRYVDF